MKYYIKDSRAITKILLLFLYFDFIFDNYLLNKIIFR